MIYVITNGTLYINDKNKPVKIEKARFFQNKTMADKVFKSSISKVLKNLGFHVEEYVENSISDDNNIIDTTSPVDTDNDKLENKINIEDLQKALLEVSAQINLLKDNKKVFADKLSELDKEIDDILHFIEFNNFSACSGYKLCKALKELRLHRRKMKDNLEIIGVLESHTLTNVSLGHTNNAIAGLDGRKYTPRVLKHLFDDKNIDTLLQEISSDVIL